MTRPVLEDHDLVGQCPRDGEIGRDDEERGLLLDTEFGEQIANGRACDRVETAQRLIHHNQQRRGDDGAGDLQPAAVEGAQSAATGRRPSCEASPTRLSAASR